MSKISEKITYDQENAIRKSKRVSKSGTSYVLNSRSQLVMHFSHTKYSNLKNDIARVWQSKRPSLNWALHQSLGHRLSNL